MKILRGDPRVWEVEESAVVIGMLDGVHLGHQALIEHLLEVGDGLTPVVLTFEPHPRAVLSPEDAPGVITPISRKARLLGDLGVEVLAVADFSEELSLLNPEEFCSQYLITGLDAMLVAVAEGFRFGAGGVGTVADLRKFGALMGFEVEPIAPAMDGDTKVSSSTIREAIMAGDVRRAAAQLGRPHRVTGTVVEGSRMGHEIGFPTANLEVDETILLPANGVYQATAHVQGSSYLAAVNVGVRPTTTGDGALTVEAHLLDFERDLYGAELSLDFVDRVRDEQAFDGIEELRAQIALDVETVRSAPL